jgi:DNA-directed RNA polymerase subunit RPC12/RpoP
MNPATTKFECSTCQAEYKLVRVETPPDRRDKQLTCLSCGAPLRNREGKFALKYFRVSDGKDAGRRNGRRSSF